MLEEKIDSFEKLEELFKKLRKQEKSKEIIYRGQSDSSWRLTSSLEREISKYFSENGKELTPEKYSVIKDKHFSNVKKYLSKKIVDQKLADNEYELWAIGQHLGLKTPLIDWTRSFYVALFFAFEEEKDVEYRSVFKLIKNLLKLQEEIKKILCVFEPSTDYYNRLTVQQGLFTHWGIHYQIEDAIKNIKDILKNNELSVNNMDKAFKKYDIKMI